MSSQPRHPGLRQYEFGIASKLKIPTSDGLTDSLSEACVNVELSVVTIKDDPYYSAAMEAQTKNVEASQNLGI